MKNKILLTAGILAVCGFLYTNTVNGIRKAAEEKTVHTQYEKIPTNSQRHDVDKIVRTYGKTIYYSGDNMIEYPYVGATTKIIKDVSKGGKAWIQVRTYYIINADKVDWERTSETGEPKYEVDVHLPEDFVIDSYYPNSDPKVMEQLNEMNRKVNEKVP